VTSNPNTSRVTLPHIHSGGKLQLAEEFSREEGMLMLINEMRDLVPAAASVLLLKLATHQACDSKQAAVAAETLGDSLRNVVVHLRKVSAYELLQLLNTASSGRRLEAVFGEQVAR
jgi:hypothetical protein